MLVIVNSDVLYTSKLVYQRVPETWRRFAESCHTIDAELVLPRTVLYEIERQQRELYEREVRDIKGATSLLEKYGFNFFNAPPPIDLIKPPKLEIRDSAIEAVARLCHELGKPFLLNSALSRPLPKRIYESLHVIVVNEYEASDLSGKADIKGSMGWLYAQGCRNVVVTLGAEGVTFADETKIGFIPARKVEALDTTGAGDCFVG